jgi:hypothetical protein
MHATLEQLRKYVVWLCLAVVGFSSLWPCSYLIAACRLDAQKIFQQPVTDEIAPGYSRVVKQPMAFEVMRTKLKRGEYISWNLFEAR